MTKKIFVFFIFIILFLLIIAISFINRGQNKNNEISLPPLEAVPTFPSSPLFDSFPDANFSYGIQPPVLPKTLPVYLYRPIDISSSVIEFAKNSGIPTNYKEISNRIFDFEGEGILLTFNKSGNALSFSWNKDKGRSPFSSHIEVIETLKQSGVPFSLSIKEQEKPMSFENEGDAELAKDLTTKAYDFLLPNNYPFVIDPINEIPALFTTHKTNGVVSFLIQIPPIDISEKGERVVIQPDEILLLLRQKKAGLYTVSSIPPTTMYTLPNFTHVIIQSVNIVYMESLSEKLLIPYFKISGIGKGGREQQYVEFFMIGIR